MCLRGRKERRGRQRERAKKESENGREGGKAK
jgi:hypothetical protein